MALKLPVPRAQNNLRAEFPAGYHRILSVNKDVDNNRVVVRVGTYADEGARRHVDQIPNNPGPAHPGMNHGRLLHDQSYEISRSEFEALENQVHEAGVKPSEIQMAAGYLAIKAKVEKYRLAEDC